MTWLRGVLVPLVIAAMAGVDLMLRAQIIATREPAVWPTVVTGIGMMALLARVWRRWRSAGLVAMAALCVLGWRADFLSGGPHRSFYSPGVALRGWRLGLAWGRRMRDPDEGETAELGAVAALAATYFGAGMSKLAIGGLDWATDAVTLRAMVLTVRAVADPAHLSFWDRAARAVVETPALARALAAATLVVQVGAPLWLCGRWLRVVWGVMLVGFHVSVLKLTGIFYGEQMVLVSMLSLSSLMAIAARRRQGGP